MMCEEFAVTAKSPPQKQHRTHDLFRGFITLAWDFGYIYIYIYCTTTFLHCGLCDLPAISPRPWRASRDSPAVGIRTDHETHCNQSAAALRKPGYCVPPICPHASISSASMSSPIGVNVASYSVAEFVLRHWMALRPALLDFFRSFEAPLIHGRPGREKVRSCCPTRTLGASTLIVC